MKKDLRLRMLVMLATLALTVGAVVAAQAVAQSGLNLTPSTSDKAVSAEEDVSATAKTKQKKALYAVVNADGTLDRGKGAVASEQLDTGAYEVLFDRNITTCAFVSTIGTSAFESTEAPGEITVAGRVGTTNGVFVDTHDSAGALADRGFHLQVSC
jgi:hypothetical protein